MKLRIEIPSIITDLEIYEKDQEKRIHVDALLKGEVIFTEGGVSMNLLSEDDRVELLNDIRDGILRFVLNKLRTNEGNA